MRTPDEIKSLLPWHEDIQALTLPVQGRGFALPNALCAQPMEGADSLEDGSPGPMTLRRYRRAAQGGSGLIWFEAVAVSKEGRGLPRQLMITKDNLPAFAHLVAETRKAAVEAGLPAPLVVMQLTHSGRNTAFERIAASSHPVMNPHQKLPMDYPIIADEELVRVQEDFAAAALLAREAGFDGVDVKCCHLYLLSELLGAANRPGRYGGSWENRRRMQLETVEKVGTACGEDFLLAVRMNVCDAMPGGFCTDERLEPDFAEAVDLLGELWARGVSLFNATMGTPYYNPHVNRPYASHPKGEGYDAPEDPLVGVRRLLDGARALQQAQPKAVVVATGLSYLRQHAAMVGAGLLREGWARSVGFGRGWLAYPDYAGDIARGGMEQGKCCVTCGLCTYLMRRGEAVGCPVRDREYLPLLRRLQGRDAK